ncbi:MAG: hypothetical protein GF388_08020, partial [Candidatus Aegiribacteria sp.]|nr:hypothetical protein [Candidatus Aegiribacteria sp.]
MLSKLYFCFVLCLLIPSTVVAESDWHWLHPYPTGFHIEGISTPDGNSIFVVTSFGEIICSTDGGETWEVQQQNGDVLSDICSINGSEAWACGRSPSYSTEGIIWRTTDGGEIWQDQTFEDERFTGVEFIDSSYGTVVGYNGAIYRSNNGGSSWNAQGSPGSDHLYGVSFISPTQGWVCGAGAVFYTETSGAFWEELTTPGSEYYYGIHFLDENNGFLASASDIYRTDNGGDSWTSTGMVPPLNY